MLFEGAQRIAVGGDDDPLPGAQPRRDLCLIIRQHARDRVLEALGLGNGDVAIAAIPCQLPRAVGLKRRRRDVERTAPDLDLVGPDPVDHLLLVEAGQAAVVALVQAPVLGHRKPQTVHLVEDEMKGADGAGQDRGEAMIEVETLVGEQPAGGARLLDAGGRQVAVPPAGEAILEVPPRLAVPKQHQRRHQAVSRSRADTCAAASFSSGRMAWSASRQEPARYFERSGDQP